MKYFGIQTPKTDRDESYIWWIAPSKHLAWDSFFHFPNKDGERNAYRGPMSEAKRAYKAIGYRCVELSVRIIDIP